MFNQLTSKTCVAALVAGGLATGAFAQDSTGATVDLSSVEGLGEVLVDQEGMTLYVFMDDTQGTADAEATSACTGGCLENWPPFTAEGEATAGEGVDEAMLGTMTAEDGSTQVTYDGWPLYYYIDDTEAGQANGQGAGDAWYVVGADGMAIEESAMDEGSMGEDSGTMEEDSGSMSEDTGEMEEDPESMSDDSGSMEDEETDSMETETDSQ